MNATELNPNTETFEIKSSEGSLSMMKNLLAPEGFVKLNTKKSHTFSCCTDPKNCVNDSKIPRLHMPSAFSLNDSLNGNESKSNKPSITPKSKTGKRDEHDQIKAKTSKEKSNRTSGTCSRKPTADGTETFRSSPTDEIENCQQRLKSALVVELKKEDSDLSYKDAQENIFVNPRNTSKKLQENKTSSKKKTNVEDKEVDEEEKKRQDRIIQGLYETIKCSTGLCWDDSKCGSCQKISNTDTETVRSDTPTAKEETNACESVAEFSSVQSCYESTLQEISNIWKNAKSLITSVKDHTVKFVEESSRSVDREQLTLEAEMIELAIDFAISYSKWKTDFFVKSLKKCLQVTDLAKSELETFMDSKIFAALYNHDDLAEMARTVQQLNLSVVKGDIDFE